MSDLPVILTGFMGSGKSSVGKVLAELLACRFVDLDAEIVASSGASINEIFDRDGEAAFRVLESEQLERVLAGGGRCVVATGGGVVLSQENRQKMRSHGIIVNLKVTLEQVLERLRGCCERPLLAGDKAPERVRALMEGREQFYADADIRIDTDGKSVEDVAALILGHLKGLSA
jgi:shikimate kinase